MSEESQQLALQMKAANGDTPPLAAVPRAIVQAEALPPPPGKGAPPSKAKELPKPAPVVSTTTAAVEPEVPLADQVVHLQPTHPTQLYIQTGAFTHYENARRMSTNLAVVGSAAITELRSRSGVLYRVRLGPISTLDDADATLERVLSSGFPDAKLVVD